MQHSGNNRKVAVSSFLNLWIISGLMLCAASCTISRDEDKMKLGLKKLAELASSNFYDEEKERPLKFIESSVS
jgi:hypothetical protein